MATLVRLPHLAGKQYPTSEIVESKCHSGESVHSPSAQSAVVQLSLSIGAQNPHRCPHRNPHRFMWDSHNAIGWPHLGYHPAMHEAPTGTVTLVFTERARDNTEYREIPVILPI